MDTVGEGDTSSSSLPCQESHQKIRVGLLLDSLDVPAWLHRQIEIITSSDYAEIVLVVLSAGEDEGHGSSGGRRRRGALLPRVYRWLEGRLSRPKPSAFETKDARSLLSDAEVLRVRPRQRGGSDVFESGDVERVASFELDVLMKYGFGTLRGEILKAARYGVWSYHHGAAGAEGDSTAALWEVFENRPVTPSVLHVLTEDVDSGPVLYRSYTATDKLFENRSSNRCYWKGLTFVPRALKRLHRLGGDAFLRQSAWESCRPSRESGGLYRAPGNLRFVVLLIKHVLRYVRRKISKAIFLRQWILMYDLGDGRSVGFTDYRPLVPPKDRLWADPFILQEGGTYYVFIEECSWAERCGHISLITIDEKGRHTPAKRILERPYHMSYPFVFTYEGERYLLPETAQNRTVEVYRCTEFPWAWELHATLMRDIYAVDATLVEHGGRWWLFANVVENTGAPRDDELFLFYADHPFATDWRPHPCNPIVSDVRRSRPAGKVFRREGELYRPCQDCSGEYGSALRINRVTRLSEREYEEAEASVALPDWDPRIEGLHTINREGRLTMIDAYLRRRRWF